MGILNKKKQIDNDNRELNVPTLSYAEKLNNAKAMVNVKDMFIGVYDDAIALHKEITEERAVIEEKLADLKKVEQDTLNFIDNLSKFVE